jgi:hypothetical protein
MITPMPKTILAKKIQVPLHVQIQHPILMLELIVPHMQMEDFKTLGTQNLMHGLGGQILLTKINLSKFSI